MSQTTDQQIAELTKAVQALAMLITPMVEVKEPKTAKVTTKIIKASVKVDTAKKVRFVYSSAAVGTKVSYVGKVGGAAVMTKTAEGWDYSKK
jgi:hypothetical protein